MDWKQAAYQWPQMYVQEASGGLQWGPRAYQRQLYTTWT